MIDIRLREETSIMRGADRFHAGQRDSLDVRPQLFIES